MKRNTSRTYKNHINQTYFITSTITGHVNILTQPEITQIMLNNIDFYMREYGFNLHGYVIMPNHFHLLLTVTGKKNVSAIVGKIKQFSARQIIEWCKNNRPELLDVFKNSARKYQPKHICQVWQDRFDDLVITNQKTFKQKLEYIHYNPVKAGLADTPKSYLHSSAADYLADISGPLSVTKQF